LCPFLECSGLFLAHFSFSVFCCCRKNSPHVFSEDLSLPLMVFPFFLSPGVSGGSFLCHQGPVSVSLSRFQVFLFTAVPPFFYPFGFPCFCYGNFCSILSPCPRDFSLPESFSSCFFFLFFPFSPSPPCFPPLVGHGPRVSMMFFSTGSQLGLYFLELCFPSPHGCSGRVCEEVLFRCPPLVPFYWDAWSLFFWSSGHIFIIFPGDILRAFFPGSALATFQIPVTIRFHLISFSSFFLSSFHIPSPLAVFWLRCTPPFF